MFFTNDLCNDKQQKGWMKFRNGTTNDLNIKTTEQVVKYVKLAINVY